MILSISNQAILFLTTILVGMVIGFIYDWFRIARKVIPHFNFLIQVEDIVYWIFVSLVMFYFMLHKNYGEIRAFSVGGAILGMILYFFTFSHLFMKVSLTIIYWIKKVISFIIYILLFPFKLLFKILSYPFNFFKGIFLNVLFCFKKILKYFRRCAKIGYSNFKMAIKKI